MKLLLFLFPLFLSAQLIDYQRQIKNKPFVSLKDSPYLAKGDGVADDTAAIQAAFTAAGASNRVWCPEGQYRITSTITIPTQTLLEGPRTDIQTGFNTTGGCTLVWDGGNGTVNDWKTMISTEGKYAAGMVGVNLDGGNAEYLVGWGDYSENNPPSQRNYWRQFTCKHFGNYLDGTPGTCIWLGSVNVPPGPIIAPQADTQVISDFIIWDVQTGIFVNSQNVLGLHIHDGFIYQYNQGINLNHSGQVKIANIYGGSNGGTSPVFITSRNTSFLVYIDNCHSEGDGSTGGNATRFFYVPLSGAPQTFPIIIINSSTEQDIYVGDGRNITSFANHWFCFGPGTTSCADITLATTLIQWKSMGDNFGDSIATQVTIPNQYSPINPTGSYYWQSAFQNFDDVAYKSEDNVFTGFNTFNTGATVFNAGVSMTSQLSLNANFALQNPGVMYWVKASPGNELAWYTALVGDNWTISHNVAGSGSIHVLANGGGAPKLTINAETGDLTSVATVRANTAFNHNGSVGISGTVVVKGSDGNNCNLVFSGGILTSETCP